MLAVFGGDVSGAGNRGNERVDVNRRDDGETARVGVTSRREVAGNATAISTTARTVRRPSLSDLAVNLAGIAVVWFTYHTARTITEGAAVDAFANARMVIEWQAKLGIGIEAALQAATPVRLLRVANIYYLVHFPVTVAALGAAFLRARHAIYPQLRDALVLTTIPAVAIHAVFPLAPPRMHGLFVDTAGTYGPNPYALPGADAANQFAAMPSLHVAWALVVAVGLWRLDHGPVLRPIAVAHAMLTPIVVMVTAHHFVIDIAAGAAIAAVALAISHGVSRRSLRTRTLRNATRERSWRAHPPAS